MTSQFALDDLNAPTDLSVPTDLSAPTDLSELHDEVHEAAGGGLGLAGVGGGGLEQILNGDLVLHRLVQQTLADRQRAVDQDLDLLAEDHRLDDVFRK